LKTTKKEEEREDKLEKFAGGMTIIHYA